MDVGDVFTEGKAGENDSDSNSAEGSGMDDMGLGIHAFCASGMGGGGSRP